MNLEQMENVNAGWGAVSLVISILAVGALVFFGTRMYVAKKPNAKVWINVVISIGGICLFIYGLFKYDYNMGLIKGNNETYLTFIVLGVCLFINSCTFLIRLKKRNPENNKSK